MSDAGCYRRLNAALMEWKWWRRRPGIIETVPRLDIDVAEALFMDQARDACEECLEEGYEVGSVRPFVETDDWGFTEYYSMIRSLLIPVGSSLYTSTFSSKEAVLQEIEDLMTGHSALMEEIKGLPLDYIDRSDDPASKIDVARQVIFDALYYFETMRIEHEPDAAAE